MSTITRISEKRAHQQLVSYFVEAALHAPRDMGAQLRTCLLQLQYPTEEHAQFFRQCAEEVISVASCTIYPGFWNYFLQVVATTASPYNHVSNATKQAVPEMLGQLNKSIGSNGVIFAAEISHVALLIERLLAYVTTDIRSLPKENASFFAALVRVCAKLLVVDCCTPSMTAHIFPILRHYTMIGLALGRNSFGFSVVVSFGVEQSDAVSGNV